MNSREGVDAQQRSSHAGRQREEPNFAAPVQKGVSSPVFDVGRSVGSAATTREHAGIISRLSARAPDRARGALLQLQKRYGNRYVQRVLAIARQPEGEEEEEVKAQRQPEEEEEEEIQAQRQGQGEPTVAPEVEGAITRKRGGGQALETGVQKQIGSALGADFGGVRVHTDTEADALNRSLNARAFTTGQDIFFRQSEYNPGTTSGQELLAHELTHVVQQGGADDRIGPSRLQRVCAECEEEMGGLAVQAKLTVGLEDDPLEREADRVAESVMRQIQRQPEEEKEASLQTKQISDAVRRQEAEEKEETVQAWRDGSSLQGLSVANNLRRRLPVRVRIQRACGSSEIGPVPSDCVLVNDPGSSRRYLFNVNCDTFAPGEEARIVGDIGGLPSGARVDLLGLASADGPATLNTSLSCARAAAAERALHGAGLGHRVRVTRAAGPQGSSGDLSMRAVSIEIVGQPQPQPTSRRIQFRVAAASFLSCAPCNPYTDDGTRGVTPPGTEPSSGFRQKHFIEVELETRDGRTITPGSARVIGNGPDITLSHYCGRSAPGHVLSHSASGAPTIAVSPGGIEALEVESTMESRVDVALPATLPGAPCGRTGTNALIPHIGNTFRARLFADGTKESEFGPATLYPSHFLYEDNTLKMFGGAPVHPRIDFGAWATSTGIPLSAAETGFKAHRRHCCSPASFGAGCPTFCAGGVSAMVPSLINGATCAALVASIAAGPCPAACAPAGGSCSPLVLPSNP